MTTEKFEFCSIGWVDFAREFLEAETKDVDLSTTNVSFNEVFTDAPAHLNPNAEGKIGWYVRVADGRLEVARGILPEADLILNCDYKAVLPGARRLSTDDPLDEASQQAIMNSMKSEGNPKAMEGITWMAGFHDALARRTK